MNTLEYAQVCVGDLSARLAEIQLTDDLDGLAGIIAACDIVRERATTQLAGRVTAETIDTVKVEAKSQLGW